MMSKKLFKNKRLLKDLNDLRKESGLPELAAKKRKCLKCNKNFTSMGNWNRICESCYRTNKHEDSIEPYAMGRK